MPEDKNFLNGFIIKEYEFDNGGTEMKISILVSEFVEALKGIEENGWANAIIKRRQFPSDKGVTHYIYENPWKPNQAMKPAAPSTTQNQAKSAKRGTTAS